jgi:hypothetical protein
MRVSFLVYGVLYVVIEMVGSQLEGIGWPALTPLDVATAVVNALLVVAVGIAVLVGLDVAGQHWRRRRRARDLEQARLAQEQDDQPITVHAWRPDRPALTAGPAVPPGHPYAGAVVPGDGYADPDFLDRHGRLL